MKLVAAFGFVVLGVILGVELVSLDVHGHVNECRAANPGYDCNLGWVRTDQFK